jgi:hypothetical protein
MIFLDCAQARTASEPPVWNTLSQGEQDPLGGVTKAPDNLFRLFGRPSVINGESHDYVQVRIQVDVEASDASRHLTRALPAHLNRPAESEMTPPFYHRRDCSPSVPQRFVCHLRTVRTGSENSTPTILVAPRHYLCVVAYIRVAGASRFGIQFFRCPAVLALLQRPFTRAKPLSINAASFVVLLSGSHVTRQTGDTKTPRSREERTRGYPKQSDLHLYRRVQIDPPPTEKLGRRIV